MSNEAKKRYGVGAWLDEHYDPDSQFYRGAIEAFKLDGWVIEVVPCGKGVVHVVKSAPRYCSDDVKGELQGELGI